MRTKPSRPLKGLRRGRAVLLTGFAAAAVSVVAAGSAQAAMIPIKSNVNYGYATVGPTVPANPLYRVQILDGTQNAPLTGTLDTTTGAISGGHIAFPPKTFPGQALSGALPAASTVTLDFVENPANSITGPPGAPPGPGAISLSGKYLIKVTLAGSGNPVTDGECDYALTDQTTPANPLVMNTETTSSPTGYIPRRFNNPAPVTAADFADITSPGSVAGNGHTATTGGPMPGTCALFDGFLDNKPADIWLGHNSLPGNGVPWREALDHGSLNVGVATRLNIVNPSAPAYAVGLITGTVPMLATDPTPSTAAMAVPGGTTVYPMSGPPTSAGFFFKPVTGEAIPGVTVTTALELCGMTNCAAPAGGVTGTFNAATGAMTLGNDAVDGNGDYKATISNATPLSCTSQPIPLGLDTSKSAMGFDPQPLIGENFAGLGGNGAVADNWASLPAAPEMNPLCSGINGPVLGVAGGVWFSHGLDPCTGARQEIPPCPSGGGGGGGSTTTTTTSTPGGGSTTTKKKCKKGRKLKKGKCVKKKKK